jgi:hypothetical protein
MKHSNANRPAPFAGGSSTPPVPVKTPVLSNQVDTAQRFVSEAYGAADRIERALGRLSGSGPQDSSGSSVKEAPESLNAKLFDLNESLVALVARLNILGNRLDEII